MKIKLGLARRSARSQLESEFWANGLQPSVILCNNVIDKKRSSDVDLRIANFIFICCLNPYGIKSSRYKTGTPEEQSDLITRCLRRTYKNRRLPID